MLDRVPIPSPNYQPGRSSDVRLIVLHTAEGSLTIESLGAYFANPGAQVSSQVGIDDKPNTVGVYVRRGDTSWTQAAFNPGSVSAELCGFSAWTPGEWHAHADMLANAAAWVAEEAAAFGIPIRALSAAEAQGGAAGVCQHVDLGDAGGGHWDCGASFPMAEVLQMASGAGAPPIPEGVDPMSLSTELVDGLPQVFYVAESGAVIQLSLADYPVSPRWVASDLTHDSGAPMAAR